LLLASVAVAGILEMVRSRTAVERIHNNELLGLSAVKQVNASVVHIDRELGSMALARTTAERNEMAERLDGYRADMRKQLEVARTLFSPGSGHALFVAVELSVRRYEEAIQEAMSRLAREGPGSGRDGIAYLFNEVRPRSHDAGDGLSELARYKELVIEQYKGALSEDCRSKRTLMLALCAASVVVGLGLGARLACGSAAGKGVEGSIEPMRRSLAALVRELAREAARSTTRAWRGPGPVAAPGREQARSPNAADLELHTPAREGASR
jgi:hypothetical protein